MPPPTAFFHRNDPLRYFNYAIRTSPSEATSAGRSLFSDSAFRSRDRLPRFEYVAQFAPDLAEALDHGRFEVELHAPLMTCPAERMAALPAVPGLEIVPATDDPRTYLTVQRRGFGGDDQPEATDQQVEDWVAGRREDGTVVGILDGRPVAVAAASPSRRALRGSRGRRARGRSPPRIAGAMTAAAARGAAEQARRCSSFPPPSTARGRSTSASVLRRS